MELSPVGVFFVVVYLSIPLVLYVFQRFAEPSDDLLHRRKRTIVLVLGDLARSPRMLNHARSLAQGGLDVDLCGYDGMLTLFYFPFQQFANFCKRAIKFSQKSPIPPALRSTVSPQ